MNIQCLDVMMLHQILCFCRVCMVAEFEKKFLASTKKDPAFISAGFTYWKEAVATFKRHVNSVLHQEATEAVEILPNKYKTGELLDASTELCLREFSKVCAA